MECPIDWMGTVVAVLEIIQPVLECVAVWRFDHWVGQGVPVVDDAIGEEVCSLLEVRYYTFMHVSYFISSSGSSYVMDNPVHVVDIVFDLTQLYYVTSFPSSWECS